MKIQDLGFFFVLLVLLYLRDSQKIIIAGLLCLVIAIPLFYLHIFFTAERLTWYAAAFFLTGTLFLIKSAKK